MPGVGDKLGRYTLLKRLALGGMGEVFVAAKEGPVGFGPFVALKVLRDELAVDQQFVDMLVDEANITKHLNHQNLVSVLDLGEDEGCYYMAMEFVQGITAERLIESLVERQRKLDVPLAVHIGVELCKALKYAHSRTNDAGEPLGIIHRDVTPANILLSTQGEVKLTDFGIARAKGRVHQTQAGVLKGKFGYMAPEMVRYEAIDARADLFCAGVALYLLAAGRHPVAHASVMEAIQRYETKRIPLPSEANPQITPELDGILMKALEPRPSARWQSAAELGEALQAVLLSHVEWRAQARDAASLLARRVREVAPEVFGEVVPRETLACLAAGLPRVALSPSVTGPRVTERRSGSEPDVETDENLPYADVRLAREALAEAGEPPTAAPEAASRGGSSGSSGPHEPWTDGTAAAAVPAPHELELRADRGAAIPDRSGGPEGPRGAGSFGTASPDRAVISGGAGGLFAEGGGPLESGVDPSVRATLDGGIHLTHSPDGVLPPPADPPDLLAPPASSVVGEAPPVASEAESASWPEGHAQRGRPAVDRIPAWASGSAGGPAAERVTHYRPDRRAAGAARASQDLEGGSGGRGAISVGGYEVRGARASRPEIAENGAPTERGPKPTPAGPASFARSDLLDEMELSGGAEPTVAAAAPSRDDALLRKIGQDRPSSGYEWSEPSLDRTLSPEDEEDDGETVVGAPGALPPGASDFLDEDTLGSGAASTDSPTVIPVDEGPRGSRGTGVAVGWLPFRPEVEEAEAGPGDLPSQGGPLEGAAGEPGTVRGSMGSAGRELDGDGEPPTTRAALAAAGAEEDGWSAEADPAATLLDGLDTDAVRAAAGWLPEVPVDRTIAEDDYGEGVSEETYVRPVADPAEGSGPEMTPLDVGSREESLPPLAGPIRIVLGSDGAPAIAPEAGGVGAPPTEARGPRPTGEAGLDVGTDTGLWMAGALDPGALEWSDDAAGRRAVATRNQPGREEAPLRSSAWSSGSPPGAVDDRPVPPASSGNARLTRTSLFFPEGDAAPAPTGDRADRQPRRNLSLGAGLAGGRAVPGSGWVRRALPGAGWLRRLNLESAARQNGPLFAVLGVAAALLLGFGYVWSYTELLWPKLRLETTPIGAEVIIDGKRQLGRTPLTVTVAPGRRHRIELRVEGYAPALREITEGIGRGRTYALEVALEREPPILSVSPVEGRVIVNGREAGRGREVRLSALPSEGQVRIRVEAEGYDPYQVLFESASKIPGSLDIPLQRTPRR